MSGRERGGGITSYSDSDWAGCRVTGKSTSGGAILLGSHFMRGWSRTQNHVTMSSAEAELIAIAKCTAELLGVKSIMNDWGYESSVVVYADPSAALVVAKGNCAGKLRHIDVGFLCGHDAQDTTELHCTCVCRMHCIDDSCSMSCLPIM